MRHFTSKIRSSHCFMFAPGLDIRLDMQAGLTELKKYLDGNTPASITVLTEFEEWCRELQWTERSDRLPPNGAFFYANINTGESVLFVA